MRVLLQILLTSRLSGIGGEVFGPHHENLFSIVLEHFGHIRAERGVPALVPDHEAPVDPHLCSIVDRAEVQQQPLTGAAVGLEGTAVPHDPVERPVPDSAQLRFGRIGNLDP